MKITIMTGARPNFIKVSPLIRAVRDAQSQGKNVSYQLVYAGSEDDPQLERSLFDDLQMLPPDLFLGVDSTNVNEITAQVMPLFERHLLDYDPDAVIVVDDLASTMAAAIVTKKCGKRLAHLVAGTRSFDINMPKEINRLVIDGLSDYLFTAGNGMGTTADQSKIYVVGNILMDTLRHNYRRFRRPEMLEQRGIAEGDYCVFTLNRRALIADKEKLSQMLRTINDNAPALVVAPLRGEARKAVEPMLKDMPNILLVEPMSYLEFGYLTAHARCIITDSGNVAEEATFNTVPCITLNNYTEHIETVKQGTNVLAGEEPEQIAIYLRQVADGTFKTGHHPDYWDGRTAERILQTLSR